MDERTARLSELALAYRELMENVRSVSNEWDPSRGIFALKAAERTVRDYCASSNESYWEPLWPGKPVEESVGNCRTGETWVNDKCQVFVYDWPAPDGPFADYDGPPVVNLSMKLNSREPWHDWREFQRIKNELCGTACWGIELYPPQRSLVDTANQYHMWVIAPGYEFPMQLEQMPMVDYSDTWQVMVKEGAEKYGEEWMKKNVLAAKQRKWQPHHKCDDLPLIGPVWESRGYRYDEENDKFMRLQTRA